MQHTSPAGTVQRPCAAEEKSDFERGSRLSDALAGSGECAVDLELAQRICADRKTDRYETYPGRLRSAEGHANTIEQYEGRFRSCATTMRR